MSSEVSDVHDWIKSVKGKQFPATSLALAMTNYLEEDYYHRVTRQSIHDLPDPDRYHVYIIMLNLRNQGYTAFDTPHDYTRTASTDEAEAVRRDAAKTGTVRLLRRPFSRASPLPRSSTQQRRRTPFVQRETPYACRTESRTVDTTDAVLCWRSSKKSTDRLASFKTGMEGSDVSAQDASKKTALYQSMSSLLDLGEG
jgi:hypothetical protein